MFGDVYCAGQSFPASFPALAGDSPLTRLAGRLLQDEIMDVMMEPHLVFGPRAWVRPRPRCCPSTFEMTRPRRPTRQHLVILPRLVDDAAASGDRPCGRSEPAGCCHTTDKEEASPPSRRHTTSTNSVSSEGCAASRKHAASPCSVSSEGCTSSRKQAASACSASSEGCTSSRKQAASACSVSSEGCTSSRKQAASACRASSEGCAASRQSSPDGALDCGGKTCRSTDTTKAGEESPWQFSVDVKGCDEVRATTERGMLVVEGRGSSDTSQQMVRYVTSLPRHVTHDSLTASLTNGRLTVTQKAAAQLLGQARTLPIDLQRQTSPDPEQQQQQQQNTDTAGEKDDLSAKVQEEESCDAPAA